MNSTHNREDSLRKGEEGVVLLVRFFIKCSADYETKTVLLLVVMWLVADDGMVSLVAAGEPMENKKKDQKHAFVCNQESQTNDEPQTKRKNAQPNVTVVPSAKISSSSPSVHSAPKSNQQQQPSIVQWLYTPQNATGQSLAMHFPTQASPPGALNQWQQYPHLFAQSASPFWQSHPPTAVAGPLLGANVSTIYQPFTDTGFPGAPSSTTERLPPNMCYYQFPGFPGPWDPSSYMAQLYQMQHPYIHSFPGALNFSSATRKVSNCLASGEHSSQIGNIRPSSKLSQKHQQLWEAQTVENVQLWSVINKLQAEVSDCKDQLKKLEEEVSSFKQKAEVATKQVIGTTQPLKKRRRPRQSMASADALNAAHLLAVGNGNIGFSSGTHSLDTAKDVSGVARQSIFHNGIFIQQGGNINPGWSFSSANEEDASEDMEGSGKDENEVMGDDTSYAAEEIGVTKDSGGWLPHK
ncbi:hypothetical protein VNO80_09672 [Phaseolus coccineus]|uniref:Uncharacterized protein n=1 Tax=Phaseolus coccineus TaxID=3886 RepID=A0AAN9RCQ9_PHACN